jgi:hypothetical protein
MIFVALCGLSTLFLLFVLVRLLLESRESLEWRERKIEAKTFYAVTPDRWSRNYFGRSGC